MEESRSTKDEKTETLHPLNCAWSVWEHREDSKASYGGNMHRLCTFHSVEEFWGYWNNIPKPSEILFDGVTRKRFADRSVDSFSVFKEGVKPEWEDPQNSTGGEWFIRKRLQAQSLDDFWDKLVLGMIGESIDPEDEITGARIVHKNRKDQGWFRFELWLRSRNKEAAEKIRTNLLQCLNSGNPTVRLLPRDCTYKEHSA